MNLYLDCEFNSWGGQLISMALVGEAAGVEWYKVVELHEQADPWVEEHVLPKLQEAPVRMGALKGSLAVFLSKFDSIHVIADWPDDIAYFCRALLIGPGTKIHTPPLTMEVVLMDHATAIPSTLPHNALADAKAIRDTIMRNRT